MLPPLHLTIPVAKERDKQEERIEETHLLSLMQEEEEEEIQYVH